MYTYQQTTTVRPFSSFGFLYVYDCLARCGDAIIH